MPVVHIPSTQAACCSVDPWQLLPEHCLLRILTHSPLHVDHEPHGDQEPASIFFFITLKEFTNRNCGTLSFMMDLKDHSHILYRHVKGKNQNCRYECLNKVFIFRCHILQIETKMWMLFKKKSPFWQVTQSSSLCEECPLQCAPPLAGGGSVQLRTRRRPLVAEPQRHGAHGDHSDQPPFTNTKRSFSYLLIFCWRVF